MLELPNSETLILDNICQVPPTPNARPPTPDPHASTLTGARALEKGDWQSCEAFVLGLPVWIHLGNEECVERVQKVCARECVRERDTHTRR